MNHSSVVHPGYSFNDPESQTIDIELQAVAFDFIRVALRGIIVFNECRP